MLSSTVKLPAESYDYVLTRIESGRYENASEIVSAAIRALQREERKSYAEARSGSHIAEGDVFRILWEMSPQSALIRSSARSAIA
jgi:putative addiction module CopG family antidote